MSDPQRIDGTFVPGKGMSFTRDDWVRFIEARPELVRPPSRQGKNPFTGEDCTFHPPQDAANIVIDGRVVGDAGWSMSEEPLVVVNVDSDMRHLIDEWANELGGTFHTS